MSAALIGDNGGPPLVEWSGPQFELITTEKQFPAMVAGFGAGKTAALIARALYLKFKYTTCNIAYYLPTYDLVATIAIPRFIEELDSVYGMQEGVDFKVIASQRPRIEFPGWGQIIFRTMDNPARIVGYEVADSLIDELDTMKTAEARNIWNKVLARNRQKKPDGEPNTIAVGTTPEGFKFVYEQWKQKPPSNKYHLIIASTYSNLVNLPDDYIPNLIDNYPGPLIQAYINGEFVNLTSGSVYPGFDRVLNYSPAKLMPNEALHIGMDFNVTNMTAIGFVQRGGWPVAVTELTKILDTPAMILAIKRRYPNNPIYIYPDASGDSRKSINASASDISLLKQAGFSVFNNPRNPFVKDRVLSVNRLIFAGDKRRLLVNTDECPYFTECLEKQAYDEKGEPDKSSGLDHGTDAGGYFINFRFPVVMSRIVKPKIGGA